MGGRTRRWKWPQSAAWAGSSRLQLLRVFCYRHLRFISFLLWQYAVCGLPFVTMGVVLDGGNAYIAIPFERGWMRLIEFKVVNIQFNILSFDKVDKNSIVILWRGDEERMCFKMPCLSGLERFSHQRSKNVLLSTHSFKAILSKMWNNQRWWQIYWRAKNLSNEAIAQSAMSNEILFKLQFIRLIVT